MRLFTVWKTEHLSTIVCVFLGKVGGGGWCPLDVGLANCVHLAERTCAAFRVLIDFWFNRHILTFVYVCVLTRDGWVWTGEHVCVFEWEPGKGEGPQVSGQKQLLLCARETSSRERERGETDQQGPDLYMGCALCADSCGDEPDPVPVRGSVRRERAKSRGIMRLTKVGTSRIWFKVMSSENMFIECSHVGWLWWNPCEELGLLMS